MHLAEQLALKPELAGEAFNLSNETQVTVLELVERVMRLMKSPFVPQVLGEASHEIKHQSLDAAKARRMLDWEPLFTLNEGLSRTIAWYTNHFQQLATPQLNVVPAAEAA